MKGLKKIQKQHFDKTDNQYVPELIEKPPIHTQLEIGQLISLIPKTCRTGFVADFGAGTGRLTIPLLKKGFEVDAIDISKDSLKTLRKLAKSMSLAVRALTSFKSGRRYSAIVGSDVLHHVDLNKDLKKINNRLGRGGIIVFSEPNAHNPSWYLFFAIKRIWKHETGILNCTHSRLQNSLKNAGFKNITIDGLGLFPRAFFQNRLLCGLNDKLGNLPFLKLFAYRLLIKAYKD